MFAAVEVLISSATTSSRVGDDRKSRRTRALLAGFQTHLAKPIQPTELLMAIGVLAARGEKGAAAGSQRGAALAIETHDEAQASAGMENQNAEPTSRPRRLSSSRCGP
ncbi:hypothetical protein WMF12_35195 [Sorangium sp. So ce363]